MNNRRLIAFGYVLWGIAFIPSMVAVVLVQLFVVSVTVPDAGFSPILLLYLVIWGGIAFAIGNLVFRRDFAAPLNFYLRTLALTMFLPQVFIILLVLTDVTVLRIVAGIIFLLALVALWVIRCILFAKAARRALALRDTYPHNRNMLIRIIDEYEVYWAKYAEGGAWRDIWYTLMEAEGGEEGYLAAIAALPYEHNEQMIARIAQTSPANAARMTALQKLPYPQEREVFASIACNNASRSIERLAALEKLPYPQEREMLISFVKTPGIDSSIRESVVRNKLPYPQERDALVSLSQMNHPTGIRIAALEKLPYPQEREVFAAAAMSVSRSDEERIAALKRLPYPQERDALVAVVESQGNDTVRLAALEKLPPSESDVYEAFIAEAEQAVLALSGQTIEGKQSALCEKARMLKRLYKMYQMKDRLQVSERSETEHADWTDYEDWMDIPLCVGGDHTDQTVHTDTQIVTWYRDFTIKP